MDSETLRIQQKRQHLEELARWRRQKYREPELRRLFLEVTSQCNERCLHCGSSCTGAATEPVATDILVGILADVKKRLGIERTQLCITGGEPLLRRDFFDLMAAANVLGYRWGMTTNGTLITPSVAQRLAACGMRTVSVSVDGLPDTHDSFRQRTGSYDEAITGTRNLADQGFEHVQITTVVHAWNINQLDVLFERFVEEPIDSWRLTTIEPMGRALDHPELMLAPDDYRRLFSFIRAKRADGWPVRYGCCHYLGLDLEREVRDAYFICSAGIYTASIMANGDIGTCLDIERNPLTIQGNVLHDDFVDVWRERFGFFRRELAELAESEKPGAHDESSEFTAPGASGNRCASCSDREFCAGGSWHSFDFAANRQRVCLKGVVF